MAKKEILSLLGAFLLGVILTLMLCSNSRNARYVPFTSNGNQILDTRNGSLYVLTTNNGKRKWTQTVPNVE